MRERKNSGKSLRASFAAIFAAILVACVGGASALLLSERMESFAAQSVEPRADITADVTLKDKSDFKYLTVEEAKAAGRPVDEALNQIGIMSITSGSGQRNGENSTKYQSIITGLSDAGKAKISPSSVKSFAIEIPSDADVIDVQAFKGQTKLVSAIVSENVQVINGEAFAGCSSLARFTVKDGESSSKLQYVYGESYYNYYFDGSISKNAVQYKAPFYQCSGLKELTLPYTGYSADRGYNSGSVLGYIFGTTSFNQATSTSQYYTTSTTDEESLSTVYSNTYYYIPNGLTQVTITQRVHFGAFSNCKFLTDIVIPQPFTKILPYTFFGCSSLRTINGKASASEIIPQGVTSVGGHAFEQSNIGYGDGNGKLVLPESVTKADISAFSQCNNLTSVDIRGAISSDNFGKSVFYRCVNITSINLPSGLIVIPEEFARECTSLEVLEMPATVQTVNSSAFNGCYALRRVDWSPVLTTINANAFANCRALRMEENEQGVEYKGLPESLQTIGDQAFYDGESLTTITVPSKVTTIGAQAFYNYTYSSNKDGLVKVVLPKSLTTIGANAFNGRTKLETVVMPNNVSGVEDGVGGITSIGDGAFDGCTKAKFIGEDNGASDGKFVLPKNLNSLGSRAFYRCTEITYVEIGTHLATIPNYAFRDCAKIKEVKFNDTSTVQAISESAFCGCTQLAKINLPASLKTIGNYAFDSCAFVNEESITLPTGLTTIGSYALQNNKSLEKLTIPETVTTLSDNAFKNCSSLTELTIPSAVTDLNTSGMFSGCTSLRTVTFQCSLKHTSGRDIVNELGSSAFDGCKALQTVNFNGEKPTIIGNLAFRNCQNLSSFTVPQEVLTIGYGAFYNCTTLSDLTFEPGSALTTVNGGTSGGYGAFENCKALENITLPATLSTLGDRAFYGCSLLESVDFGANTSLTKISKSCFQECAVLNSLKIPSSVATIDTDAFNKCVALQTLKLPESLTQIGDRAFSGCTLLKFEDLGGSKYIPSGVNLIGAQAFNGCVALENINLPTGITTISNYMFQGCSGLQDVVIEGQIVSIGTYAFAKCGQLESVTVNYASDTVSIGDYAFQDCAALAEYTLPGNIVTINQYTFSGCTALSKVNCGGDMAGDGELKLPESLATIRQFAFNGCAALTKFEMSRNLATIEKSAFASSGLQSIKINQALTTVSESCFENCASLSSVEFPEGNKVSLINSKAFYNCAALETIDLKYYTGAIGTQAFWGCSFTNVDLPAAITRIDSGAFGGNGHLTEITVPFIGRQLNTNVNSGASSETLFGYIFGNTTYSGGTAVESWYGTSGYNRTTNYIPTTLKTVKVLNGTLKYGAFYNCSMLESITLPSSLTRIGDYAFYNCKGLLTLEVPSSVTTIDGSGSSSSAVSNVFTGCTALQKLTTPIIGDGTEEHGYMAYLFGVRVSNKSDGLNTFSSLQEIEITNATKIGAQAFNSIYLTTIKINGAVSEIEKGALYGCRSLETLSVPFVGASGDGHFGAIFGDQSFDGTTVTPQRQESGEEVNYFIPTALTSVTVLGGDIGYGAFYGCSNITQITLPESLENIGAYAFYGSGITEITVPRNVEIIPEYAFYNCSSLESVDFGSGRQRSIGEFAFANCSSLGNITLADSVLTIGANAFNGCSALQSITLPQGVDTIGNYTFKDCVLLEEIDFKELHSIGQGALDGCSNLTTITLSRNLTEISAYTFQNCSSLRYIKVSGKESGMEALFPDNIVKIGNYAFDGCRALQSVKLSSRLNEIGQYAFYGNSGLRILDIPAGVKTVGISAFQGCVALEFVYLPDAAAYGTNAFSGISVDATLIASSKAAYDKITSDSTNMANSTKDQVTYLVKIEYYEGGAESSPSLYQTEEKLFNKQYNYFRNEDGTWSINEGITALQVALDGYEWNAWYTEDEPNRPVTLDVMKTLLADESKPATIKLYSENYSQDELSGLKAREEEFGLVYGDVNLQLSSRDEIVCNYLNDYVLDESGIMLDYKVYRVKSWSYESVSGVQSTPERLRDAGRYTAYIDLASNLGSWAQPYEFTFEIAQYRVDLAVLRWAAERTAGKYSILSDFNGEVNDESVNVRYSAVRSTGSSIGVKYYVDYTNDIPKSFFSTSQAMYFINYSGATSQTEVGKYEAQATFTFNDSNGNYVFYSSLREENLANYGSIITVLGDGTATVQKTWYIIPGSSTPPGGDGGGGGGVVSDIPLIDPETMEEWEMVSGWIFGDNGEKTYPVNKPNPGYAQESEVHFTLTSQDNAVMAPSPVRAVAREAGISDIRFDLTDFTGWINYAVPVGDYYLTIDIDASGGHGAVKLEYAFSVESATTDPEGFDIQSSYTSVYDGTIKLPKLHFSLALDQQRLRQGTKWEQPEFESLYASEYEVTYSLGNNFRTPEFLEGYGYLTDVNRDGEGNVIAYTVYYKISAANCADVGGFDAEHVPLAEYSFTLTITPADNAFITEYSRGNWYFGDEPSLPTPPTMKFGDGRYTPYIYTDPDCTQLLTGDYEEGTYYVIIKVPGTNNYNELTNAEPYTFTVLHKEAAPAQPNVHRQPGLSSPNGLTETTPGEIDMRALIIALIIAAIVLVIIIIIISVIISHRRRKKMYDKMMMFMATYGQLNTPYAQQQNAAVGYAAPMFLADRAEDTDPDGFYDAVDSDEIFTDLGPDGGDNGEDAGSDDGEGGEDNE